MYVFSICNNCLFLCITIYRFFSVCTVCICLTLYHLILSKFPFISGSRLERAQNALHTIGPAVINGGITTFLAVILLCDSKSHAFITFFKVFFLTVLFGLYHAIIFFPVLLSLNLPFLMSYSKPNVTTVKPQLSEASDPCTNCHT